MRLGPALDIILHQHAYPVRGRPHAARRGHRHSLGARHLPQIRRHTSPSRRKATARCGCSSSTYARMRAALRAYAQMEDGSDFRRSRARHETARRRDCSPSRSTRRTRTTAIRGIVALEVAASLAEAVQHYFRQSEQLSTGIVAAVHQDLHGRWRGGRPSCCSRCRAKAAPRHTSDTPERKTTGTALMMLDGHLQSLRRADRPRARSERAALPPVSRRRRARLRAPRFPARMPLFRSARGQRMLRSLPRAEIEMLADDGIVSVTCRILQPQLHIRRETARRAL